MNSLVLIAWLVVFAVAKASPVIAQSEDSYRLPPEAVVRAVDGTRVPAAVASAAPTGRWIAIEYFASRPSVRELDFAVEDLAGWRVSSRTNSAIVNPRAFEHFAVYDRMSSRLNALAAPPGHWGPIEWSPDGEHFAVMHEGPGSTELWIGSPANSTLSVVPNVALNAARTMRHYTDNLPCSWLTDSSELLCLLVPNDRGAEPANGAVAPRTTVAIVGAPGFRDRRRGLLHSSHDEAMYDFYMTSQPAYVNAIDGRVAPFATKGIYTRLVSSPDRRYVLATRIQKPYSYETADDRFPRVTEVYDRAGHQVRTLAAADQDHSAERWRGDVPRGPRGFFWCPGESATIAYYETVAAGSAESRDKLLILRAPFAARPLEIFLARGRMGVWPARTLWGANGFAIVEEYDFQAQKRRSWLLEWTHPARKPELLWEFDPRGAYASPGEFVTALAPTSGRDWAAEAQNQDSVLLQDGRWVYLRGMERSDTGDRPFIDRLDLTTRRRERLFTSGSDAYEEVVSALDPAATVLLVSVETPTVPQNFRLFSRRTGTYTALTAFADPVPEITGTERVHLEYRRADGLPLSGDLYLAVGYASGKKPPLVIWGYPTLREGSSKATDFVGRTSTLRFPRSLAALTPLPLVTQGYSVLLLDGEDGMPLTGGRTANDTNNEQLAADVKAAIDKVVALGIADRGRIGIAGHSYGGFMVANLLANTSYFSAGVAFSGLFDLSQVPFGFQEEERTYWQAPDVYRRMSPFDHADTITAPLLLVHGLDDESPAQSEQSVRLFDALDGLGRPTRLVLLPQEGHVPRTRENVLQEYWEMLAWFNQYLMHKPSSE